MRLLLRNNLLYITVTIMCQDKSIGIPDVIIDTGSGSTIFSADAVEGIGISPIPQDILYSIRGVGGTETVFSRRVDFLAVGEKRLADFPIEVGAMDYGFAIQGILGMDYLIKVGAVIDLSSMSLSFR